MLNNEITARNVYKILTLKEWESFQNNGCFEGSDMDKKDEFIHAAFEDQCSKIIKKFFKGIKPLFLLELDISLLAKGCLKIEANKQGGEKYPHLYGDFPLSAVISYKRIN